MMKLMIAAATAAVLAAPAAAAGSEAAAAGAAAAWTAAEAAKAPAPGLQPRDEGGTVVSDKTTDVDVDLNAKTVKCSAADYSMPMLKVLIPGLAGLTVLNHRNTKEGAPCVAAGRCDETLSPESVLKSGDGIETVPVRVVLKKLVSLDGAVCRVSLVETVTTTIRGLPFFHERYQQVADRAAADCR